MAYDGIQYGQRVDGTTERKLRASVVDNVLNSPTYFSRILSQGLPFMGKTEDITVDVVSDNQGEFFTGLEQLSATAANTTVTLSYAHTAFHQPKVNIMLDSFANAGQTGTIPLDSFKYRKAAAEVLQRFGSAIYADGSANRPLGLGAIVDDGTSVGTIGGQSRSTYTTLKATVTSWSTALTLLKMATLHDAVSAAGMVGEEPNVGLGTKTIFSLYEQLLQPSVRAEYNQIGYPQVSVRGKFGSRNDATIRNGAGFSFLSYRNLMQLKDDFATAQTEFMLNEGYFDWKGRTIVPDEWKDKLEKVNLGTKKVYEGTGAEALDMPSEYNGFFFQKDLVLPTQAGMVAQFYVIGQVVAGGFRRSGKGTNASTV